MLGNMCRESTLFQSTLPARGATSTAQYLCYPKSISIHAPRTGSDLMQYLSSGFFIISIHAPRTGSDNPPFDYNRINAYISIHASRTGSDFHEQFAALLRQDFNPRSPHGERPSVAWRSGSAMSDFNPRSPHGERQPLLDITIAGKEFQSTLPARGATQCNGNGRRRPDYFNPRSPHGERHKVALKKALEAGISIHAPRTGSDAPMRVMALPVPRFQSTLPARGATHVAPYALHGCSDFNPRSPHGERRRMVCKARLEDAISIHAPRTGSDPRTYTPCGCSRQFQSTLPARGATKSWRLQITWTSFQSTLPARGATDDNPVCAIATEISIHAPRTGSDHVRKVLLWKQSEFQSTLPARGATAMVVGLLAVGQISIHAPRTGSDGRALPSAARYSTISIHAPRTGSDVILPTEYVDADGFQSTLPARGATIDKLLPPPILKRFQSTLPARGATFFRAIFSIPNAYFNPRSPHGERRSVSASFVRSSQFQSTLPARGATTFPARPTSRPATFQSTLPARGATIYNQ